MKLVDPARYAQLKESQRLPSPKGVPLVIIRLLQRENYRIEDLVRLVQSDPAIAGELLRFSNAASFSRNSPVVSLSKAITILGVQRVRVTVIAFSVMNNNRAGVCPQFDYETFWSRALATAISAQTLAPYVKINPEENFTAGLLCTLGELALASIFPESYGEIISGARDDNECIKLERNAFGTDRHELNATLLLEWGLPLELVTAVYHCDDRDMGNLQEGSRIHGLTLSLNIALAYANICVAGEGTARGAMLPDLYAKTNQLGISQDDTYSMANNIIKSWQDWGRFLKIQTQEILPFSDLIEPAPATDPVPLNEFKYTLRQCK
jgi:HD-like signal output (HDOD) protein